jgi:hypothetical protein
MTQTNRMKRITSDTGRDLGSQLAQLMATDSFTRAKRAAEYEQAMRQRSQRIKHEFLTTEHLSAEPRGNEVDLRRRK